MPRIYLGETGSSFTALALVFALSLLMPVLVDPKSTLHRTVLLAISVALALRYGWWRATETVAPLGLTWDWAASWSLLGLELASIAGSISAFTMLSRTKDRSGEVARNLGWWGDRPPPRVAILIATYNEELEVLERTIVGALGLRHENKTIHILDDGRRDWLRDFCAQRGVDYITRPDNRHAKAGNMNHALDVLAADPPDFVAVLDADFVPHRGFLSHTLALFHDEKVGLVQTPQHFFNPDPIQQNLALSKAYPDEQRFFFDTMQASRDAWDIAFCCGTSSISRWQALTDCGGFPTDSITEDFMLTVVLQSHGWRTVYLNEALTEGLAPEGLKEYITQRSRWCLGMMQIAHSSVGPFSRSRIRLRDRWSVIDAALYWLTTFPFRIAALVFPLLYWYFNIIVVDASVSEVIGYFGVYYLWTLSSLNVLSKGNSIVPLINDVSQLIGAPQITRAALTGVFKPHGHPFKVTAKGGDRSRRQIQWRLMAPFAALFALTVIGLVIGIASDRFAFFDAGDGKVIVLFWTIYNLFVLFLTIVTCVELPRREHHVADNPERVRLTDGTAKPAWMVDLTTTGARIRGFALPEGRMVSLAIKDVGEVAATSLGPAADGCRLQFHSTPEQFEALQLRLYAEDNVPGIPGARTGAVIYGLFRRFTFKKRTERRS